MSEYAGEKEIASALAISVHTLRKWRWTGANDLPFYKVGRRVIYRWSDVAEWLDGRRAMNAGEARNV